MLLKNRLAPVILPLPRNGTPNSQTWVHKSRQMNRSCEPLLNKVAQWVINDELSLLNVHCTLGTTVVLSSSTFLSAPRYNDKTQKLAQFFIARTWMEWSLIIRVCNQSSVDLQSSHTFSNKTFTIDRSLIRGFLHLKTGNGGRINFRICSTRANLPKNFHAGWACVHTTEQVENQSKWPKTNTQIPVNHSVPFIHCFPHSRGDLNEKETTERREFMRHI